MTSSALPYGKVLDYEQFIDHQLRRTRARIKINDFMTAGLLLLAVLIAVLFVEVVLDHLVGLPFWSRRIVLQACAAGSGTYAVLGIVYPLLRRVNGFYAARMIEGADPSFQNSLITYLDLRHRSGELSRPALAAIEARAVYHLTRLEIDDVVDRRRLLRVVSGFSAVVVVFCLYAVLSPRSILDSARRGQLLADLVRPTRTRLLNITPGDDPALSRIVAGTEAVFTVEVRGAGPSRVVLHASTDEGRYFASYEFRRGTRHDDAWRTTIPNVRQDIDYHVTAGDAQSRTYHLEVIPAPMVTGVGLDLDFPAYLNRARRTGLEGGSVEAIEGTIVTVRARTSAPARAASLTFTQAAPVSMDVSLSDPRELTGRFKVEKSGAYTINYRTTAGHRNPNPVVHEIIALPDRPPQAMFEKPELPDIDVSVDEQVELVMEGSDDHGVRDVTLKVDRNGQTLLAKTLLRAQQPSPLHFRATERLDLGAWKLEPGAELIYWMTVRDTKAPFSNRFEAPRRRIKVGPPADSKGLERLTENDRDAAKPADLPESAGRGAVRLTADELRQLRRLQVLLGLDPPQPKGKPNGAGPIANRSLPSLARPGATKPQAPGSGQDLAEGSATPGTQTKDDGRARTADSQNQETTNPNGATQSPKASRDAKPREKARRPGRESPGVDAQPVPPSDRTGDQKEPNPPSKTSTPLTNAASGKTEPTGYSAPGRVPESKDKKPQPDGKLSSDARRARSPNAAPTSATTGQTHEATKAKGTNDDQGSRPASEKPMRPVAKEEDSSVAPRKAGSREGDRNRSEPEQKKDRSPEEPKKKPEARPQPPEKPAPPPERSDRKDSPRPSAKQEAPKDQDGPRLENRESATAVPQFSPPGMDGLPPDPNVRERLPHPPGSNGDTYISKKKSPSKSASKTSPPPSPPPTRSSPKKRGNGRRPPPDRTDQRKGGRPGRSPAPGPDALKGTASASHEPVERGEGSAPGGDRGEQRGEAVGGRGGPPKEDDPQGTPDQLGASGGLQTAGGPGLPRSKSGMNQVPSDRDEAAPGAEGESRKAPLRFGDRSSASGRSTGGNSGGGGTTPAGNRGQIPSVAGLPTSDSVKDPPRKSLSVAQTHPPDWNETVAPDVALVDSVLRKLEELLRSNQVGPGLERESGMSREQMEQFVTRFKPRRKATPGPGRTVEVEPGYERAFHDEPTSIALDGETVGSLATRSSANVVRDQQGDIAEGIRFVVPAEIRSRFEAYKSSISHSIPSRP